MRPCSHMPWDIYCLMGVHMRILCFLLAGSLTPAGGCGRCFPHPISAASRPTPQRFQQNGFKPLPLFVSWFDSMDRSSDDRPCSCQHARCVSTRNRLDAGCETYAASWHEDPVTGICTLQNGLVARRWVLAPNAATIGVDNLMTGAPILRSIRPEASLIIDGMPFPVGGLQNEPNHAFIRKEWIQNMREMNGSLRYTRYQISQPLERFPWKRVRHHAPDAVWPPKGIQVDFHYSGLVSRKETSETKTMPQTLEVVVHYILYDGIPIQQMDDRNQPRRSTGQPGPFRV